jgi:hypothetical protein
LNLQKMVIHVPDIMVELLFPRQCVATVDLGPAGNSRAHVVTARLFRRIERQILHQQWPRPHEAHFPPEHVPEFGKFVEAGSAQPFAQPRKPVLVRQQFAGIIASISHCAKLYDMERFAMQARTFLGEQHGTAKPDADDQRHDQPQWKQ